MLVARCASTSPPPSSGAEEHAQLSGALVGADAALVVTPYYNKPTQEGLYQHYKAIAAKDGTPLQAVEAIAGKTVINKAPGGTYIMTSDGRWVRK